MADIEKLLIQFKSDNPNKRYEACEELRVAPSIPEEAISALCEATSDPNPDVADAAQRALDIHTIKANEDSPNEMTEVEEETTAALPGNNSYSCRIMHCDSNKDIQWWKW